MAEPVLYSFRRCPYAMRARLALTVSDARYVLREVRLADKPAEMLRISPKGTVPVLELPSGIVIDESLEIMMHVLQARDPENWLSRTDVALIEANDREFKHHLNRYKYADRYGSDAVVHRSRALSFLQELDLRLAAAGQLCGFERGFADAAIMPFVRQFAATDPAWFGTQALPHLNAWLAGHIASDLFKRVMVRTAPSAPCQRDGQLGSGWRARLR
ncbi:glutathione S-transferase [Sphingomonas trueperi]|uniref:glutathione S-transferase n=1 Tax=Sphingomonas trueperi TaxID=53317 RepID=UPI000EABE1DD